MRGSYSPWLPLVALFPLILRIGPVDCHHTEDYRSTFLLTIKNNGSGLEIFTIFPKNYGSVNNTRTGQWPNRESESQILFIPGHNISSKCGDQYFRCQQLLVINESPFVQYVDSIVGDSLSIVFVPLEDGVLLLSYRHDSLSIMTMNWTTFILNSFNCTPTVFYNINSTIYMVCINTYEAYIAVYELRLNNYLSDSMVEIEGVALVKQLTYIHDSTSYSSLNISNFIIVDHRIFFAIGNTIIVMDIFDTTQSQQYSELFQCAQINKLVPIATPACTTDDGNQPLVSRIVASCTDKYICYNPELGDWHNIYLFSSYGVPYLCPDNHYRANLLANGTLQFSVGSLSSNTINDANITNGICFESQNRTYFAYSDQQHNNVYVYNFITQESYSVFPYDCTHQDCPQLLFLENQYLVIGDANHDLVLDTKTNFSLIINISNGIADILAVLHGNLYHAITPSPPIIHSTTTVPSVPVHSRSITATVSPDVPTAVSPIHNNIIILVGVISAAVMVMTVVLISIIIGFSIRHWRRKWYNSAYRISRMRFITNPSPPVPLLAADNAQEEEEEEGESYEMESVINLREPRHFDKGWRLTTTV